MRPRLRWQPRRPARRAAIGVARVNARLASAPPTLHARPPTSGLRPRARSAPARPSSTQVLLCKARCERVPTATKARVDGSAREVEEFGDLAGPVLEEVSQDDHGAVLGRELGQC